MWAVAAAYLLAHLRVVSLPYHCMCRQGGQLCRTMVMQVDACQQHASLLLADQPDNEDAAIMLAEIMAHQVPHS